MGLFTRDNGKPIGAVQDAVTTGGTTAVVVWIASLLGVDVPAEAAAGLAGLLAGGFNWLRGVLPGGD